VLDALKNDTGNFIVTLIICYFIIKWAVKNGIKEAHRGMKLEKYYRKNSEDNTIDE
jgi:Family of unknown function (DUF6019)